LRASRVTGRPGYLIPEDEFNEINSRTSEGQAEFERVLAEDAYRYW
jgi:hypothetical protein